MPDSLLMSLLLNVSLLLLAATVLTELKPLRRLLRPYDISFTGQVVLAVVFGILAILSTFCGFRTNDAIINTRVISVAAAGLLGGPVAGIGAGIIGGLHRYFYNPTSFTALGCCVGTIWFGVVGAFGHRYCRNLLARRWFLVCVTVVGELFQVGWLLLLARPLSAVVALESLILLPKIVINSLGMVLFFSTFLRLRQGRVDELIEGQAQALYIANRALPYLREGLRSGENLQTVANIVRDGAAGYRVLLSDREKVLASAGYELEGDGLPDFMTSCIEQRETVVRRPTLRLGRGILAGPEDVIAVPIEIAGETVGSMALLLDQSGLHLAKMDVRFAENLARFFSTILELNNLSYEVELRRKAEFRAFQSQINPHFFCNALNTISALCRSDSDKARGLLLVLANYYRQTLSINEEFVPLEMELNNVENYLTIAQARFVDVIHFTLENTADTAVCQLPPLIIQPLVENAVRHGGTAVDDRTVLLRITQEDGVLTVSVSDRGHGFPEEVLQALEDPKNKRYSGLFNVSKRLVGIYGWESRLRVASTPEGSTVSFSVPPVPPISAAPSAERSA